MKCKTYGESNGLPVTGSSLPHRVPVLILMPCCNQHLAQILKHMFALSSHGMSHDTTHKLSKALLKEMTDGLWKNQHCSPLQKLVWGKDSAQAFANWLINSGPFHRKQSHGYTSCVIYGWTQRERIQYIQAGHCRPNLLTTSSLSTRTAQNKSTFKGTIPQSPEHSYRHQYSTKSKINLLKEVMKIFPTNRDNYFLFTVHK